MINSQTSSLRNCGQSKTKNTELNHFRTHANDIDKVILSEKKTEQCKIKQKTKQ